MRTLRKYLALGAIILLVIGSFSCGIIPGWGGGQNTVFIDVFVTLVEAGDGQTYLGGTDEVLVVRLYVKRGSTLDYVDELDGSGANWTGFAEVQFGIPTTFEVVAYNQFDQVLFEGSVTQTFADEETYPELYLDINQVPAPQAVIPQIASVEYPAIIGQNGTATVTVSVTGGANEQVVFNFNDLNIDPIALSNQFDPNTGLEIDDEGSLTVTSEFTAPSVIGFYEYEIEVVNWNNIAISQSFTVEVREAADLTFGTIRFAPIIKSIDSRRETNTIVFEAVVEDDGASLTYLWSLNNSNYTLSFTDNTTNPAVLTNYSLDMYGDIELAVTDDDANTTTITFPIAAGQYPVPNEIIIDSSLVEGVALFTNTSFVEYSSYYYSEGYTVEQSLLGLASAPEVTPFTEYDAAGLTTALDGKAAVAFPSFYDYRNPNLAADAIIAIQTFVSDGGVLLKFDMTWNDLYFMNSLFSWNLNNSTYFYNYETLTQNSSAAAGTVFETASSSISIDNGQLSYLYANEFPAGALNLYGPSWDQTNYSVLMYMPYGDGYIVWFGNGWYNMLPIGSEDGGWLDLLELALSLNN